MVKMASLPTKEFAFTEALEVREEALMPALLAIIIIQDTLAVATWSCILQQPQAWPTISINSVTIRKILCLDLDLPTVEGPINQIRSLVQPQDFPFKRIILTTLCTRIRLRFNQDSVICSY